MSTNKTEHYQLNQWVKTDQVLMDDFNADNSKIDSALKSASDRADAAKAKADNIATTYFSPENLPYVVGSYKGDGTQKRRIELGFTPKAVLLFRHDGFTQYNEMYCGGLVLPNRNVSAYSDHGVTSWDDNSTVMQIVENGFQVTAKRYMSLYFYSNETGKYYYYVALK